MRTSITLITAPTSEPVTLQEAKSWARIDSSDEDSLLSNLITVARQEAEKYLRSALMPQTWEMTLDVGTSALDDVLGDGFYEFPINQLYGTLPNVIALPYAPIQSITSVKYFDTANTENTYSSSNYTLDAAGGRLMLNQSAVWASNMRPNASAKIRYVAGYANGAAVPMAIRIAIMNYVLLAYEQRGICENTTDPLIDMQKKLAMFRKPAI